MGDAQAKVRQGPDHREGEQVTFLDVKQFFGLGHVRVGSWVSSEESLIAANLVFDALADLALALGLPPKALGLRERLNLAFGHGGQQGVMAHYSPSERTLALAKHAGAGAVAHEFWHAFDHHLCDTAMDVGRKPMGRFASELWLKDVPLLCHPLNDRLEALFKCVLLSCDTEQPSDYVRRAIALDKACGRLYFAHPSELMARAFEAAIESEAYFEHIDTDSGEIYLAPLINPYLVTGTHKTVHPENNVRSAPQRGNWGTMPPGAFPDAAHRQAIMKAMAGYFIPLGRALAKTLL
ncbi:CLCA_X family protein [Shewanella litorisediminis]